MDSKKQGKSGISFGTIFWIVVVFLFLFVDRLPGTIGDVVAIALALLIPVVIFIVIFKFLRLLGKGSRKKQHTHDRINHRTDLVINSRTGKVVESSRHQVETHSPQEHWKRQLDDLLANGTIDRAEYKALMNRRF